MVADGERVALSVPGAVVLNLTLTINHQPSPRPLHGNLKYQAGDVALKALRSAPARQRPAGRAHSRQESLP